MCQCALPSGSASASARTGLWAHQGAHQAQQQAACEAARAVRELQGRDEELVLVRGAKMELAKVDGVRRDDCAQSCAQTEQQRAVTACVERTVVSESASGRSHKPRSLGKGSWAAHKEERT